MRATDINFILGVLPWLKVTKLTWREILVKRQASLIAAGITELLLRQVQGSNFLGYI